MIEGWKKDFTEEPLITLSNSLSGRYDFKSFNAEEPEQLLLNWFEKEATDYEVRKFDATLSKFINRMWDIRHSDDVFKLRMKHVIWQRIFWMICAFGNPDRFRESVAALKQLGKEGVKYFADLPIKDSYSNPLFCRFSEAAYGEKRRKIKFLRDSKI